jgi:hypothetical protein
VNFENLLVFVFKCVVVFQDVVLEQLFLIVVLAQELEVFVQPFIVSVGNQPHR